MNKNKKIFRVLGIIIIFTAIISFICMTVMLRMSYPDNSIGIIGGADKPTVLFLFSQFKLHFLAELGILLLGIILLVLSAKKK